MATSFQKYDPESWRDLNDKIVMVTGASSGIGWELCIDLAKSNCRIITAAHRTHNLKVLCDKINNLDSPDGQLNLTEVRNTTNVRAVAVQLDVSADGPTIEACVKKAWNAFGYIDVLINNAGITGPLRTPLDLPEEDWDRAYNTNVRGSWLVSKYVGLQMRVLNQGGSIINISSVSGLNRVQPHGAVAYASSKAALNSMTKVMALELGKNKIRVNSIAPGIFQSEITEKLLQNKWFKNVASKMVPLKEFGTADPAVTSLVRYLIHGSSSYVTAVGATEFHRATLCTKARRPEFETSPRRITTPSLVIQFPLRASRHHMGFKPGICSEKIPHMRSRSRTPDLHPHEDYNPCINPAELDIICYICH